MELYDITKVCNMLKTTSRTLRFYETEGLIQSTVTPPSHRRYYTQSQVDTIERILALRALGLPIKKIKQLMSGELSLEDAVRAHRVDIIKLMGEKKRQINLLEEVLHDIGHGKNASSVKSQVICTEKQIEISEICTNAILSGDYNTVMSYFSDDMKIMLPQKALVRAIEIATRSIGVFVKKLPAFRDEKAPNVVILPLEYEKSIFRLKFVFHGDIVCGLWTDYA